ncbi:MAG: acid-shock protein [Gammaproteobacteria bacterium]|nr:acid-shock protein [Gammaproteobacteria bacterium]MDE2139572.1 acid-shock protein [Gammaproteobacteria bacterium]MDE2273896.1 acid-shock protein [Gammaproteobacteria bacterium]
MKRQVMVGLIAAALFAFAGATLAQAPAASTAPTKKEAVKHEMNHKKMEHHKKWTKKKSHHKAAKKEKTKAPEAKTR